ncbi:MAG: RrF2 family transcriptional regulator [Opitutales bacterium]
MLSSIVTAPARHRSETRMLKYGKTAQTAISVVSYLAERYDGGQAVCSSLEIAQARNLPKPVVAKLMTQLSQAGLLRGTPGPRGGYTLTRPPEAITLFDIVERFENTEGGLQCPFGPDWCGNGDPCPLHFQLLEINQRLMKFLRETTFDAFKQGSVPGFAFEAEVEEPYLG